MTSRRDRSSPAVVLASIQQTGTELIRQVGIAAAYYPHHDRVPRSVMIAVLQQCSALHATLFEHISAIEQAIESTTPAIENRKRDEQ